MSIQKLTNYINTLESHIEQHETINLKVSKSSVGWQIDHILRVVNGIIGLLKNAPTDKTPNLNFFGRVCLALNYIPRGKGKAPKNVMPLEIITKADIEKQIAAAKQNLPQLNNVNEKATFKHPYFGILNKKQTIRFIEVHTKHHVKIVRDILKD